jgi:hypothetical protein
MLVHFYYEICDDWFRSFVITGLARRCNSVVLFVAVAEGDFVFIGKGKELVPVYPVLTARQPEGDQVAFFYPSQHGYLAHAAVLGYGPGGQVLGVLILHLVHWYFPPYGQRH